MVTNFGNAFTPFTFFMCKAVVLFSTMAENQGGGGAKAEGLKKGSARQPVSLQKPPLCDED